MRLKDIHETAGQFVQDLAVENQRLQGNIEDLEVYLLEDSIGCNFDWKETAQGFDFWNYVDDGMTEQELKEKYPDLPWKPQTPKEIAQNILKGLSDEVLEEIRKQLETNKTK